MIDRRRFLGISSFALASTRPASSGLFAQSPKPRAKAAEKSSPAVADEQVNRVLAQARTDGRRLPGMVGGIIRGEKLVAIGAVGVRKVGASEPMRVDDLVHLGSCTKAMTATLIGTFVDEGKLGWETTVASAFPDWAAQIHPDFRAVTLDQLLRHRSGLPANLPWGRVDRSASIVAQRRSILMPAMGQTPEFEPGSKYSYSNAGYVLAGMMAEQAGRASWEDLIRRRVFGPLGMTTAGFGAPGTRGRLDQPWGHRAEGDTVEAIQGDNAPALGPAGTVHCSLTDWARFGSFHLRGSLGGLELLKPETLKTLHTPHSGEEYAGGWISLQRSWANGRALNHAGSNTLWHSVIWLAPARNLGFLAVVNAAGKAAEEATDQAISGLIRLTTMDDRPRRR